MAKQNVNDQHCKQLCHAVEHLPITEVQRLLRAGAWPNGCGCGDWHNDKRPLILAMRRGRLDVVQMLLRSGININGFQYDKQTPLQWAVTANSPNMVQLLLLHGANPNSISRGCTTAPLELAITSYSHGLVVRHLCVAGADRRSALMFATLCENTCAVTELLALGERHCRLEAEMAARLGKEAILTKLLQHGIPPDEGLLLEATRSVVTHPLCSGMIQVLARAGARASHSAAEAFLAVKERNATALQQVLALPGANPNARDQTGASLLSIAATNADIPCTRVLVQAGAVIGVAELLVAGGNSNAAPLATSNRRDYVAGLLLWAQSDVFMAVCKLPAIATILNDAISSVCGPNLKSQSEMMQCVMASSLNWLGGCKSSP